MKTLKKTVAVIMTALMVFSVLSVSASAAYGCDHNIGTEGSTLKEYSRVASTCDKKGKVYYACNNCTFTTVEELEIDPNNHTWGEWQQVIAPTCAQEGTEIRYCTGENCTASAEGTIPVTDVHTYADASELDFWWTEEGITVGDTYKTWKIEAIPTCFDEGIASTVCTVCSGAEITAELPAHSYNFIEDESNRIPSTCASHGICSVVCGICNANYSLSLPFDETNHIWKYKVTKAPTCTEEGIETAYCSRHDNVADAPTRSIPATGHTFKNYVYNKNATCVSDGTKTAKCENCDAKDTVIAEGTKLGCLIKWRFKDAENNCSTGGVAEHVCVNCQTVYDTKVISAGTAHENRTVSAAATCVKNGYEYTECTFCGIITSEKKTLPMTGHDENRVNKTPSNCITKTNGVDMLVCKDCGAIREEEIPYTHRLVTVSAAVEPTCTTAGKTEHNMCLDCDYVEDAKTIDPLGHKDTDNDGCCNVCYVFFVQNSQGEVVDCKCLCHNPDGIAKLVFKFINFFYKLFGINQLCDCGKLHYGVAGIN